MGLDVLWICAALITRAAGSVFRRSTRKPVAWIGWVICGLAAWIAASQAGAWTPLWPPAGVAGLVGLAAFGRHRFWLRVVADLAAVGAAGSYSVPILQVGPLVVVALLLAVIGMVLDRATLQLSTRSRRLVVRMTGLAVIVAGAGAVALLPAGSRRLLCGVHALGIAPLRWGTRIDLDTGAVAWLDRPAGNGPFHGALFFHGNHNRGARQKAGQVIRRAFVAAGYLVLSVDHPGYGSSPCPDAGAPVADWDPLPTDMAALKRLRSMPDVDGVTLIGHSMGCNDALRLAGVAHGLERVVLFGAGLKPPPERGGYWYRRFHHERGLRAKVPWRNFLEIRSRYYDNARHARKLPANHAPIVFVQFTDEHAGIARTRGANYEAIPGRKQLRELDCTHYFDTLQVAGLMLGDTRATSRLVGLAGSLPANGR